MNKFFLYSASRPHQPVDVSADREGQPLKVVAAFQQGDDAPVAAFGGDIHQFFCRPGEIMLAKAEVGQRIALMRIKPGGDQDQVRRKSADARQDHRTEAIGKDAAVVAGPQRRIDDGVMVACLTHLARARIKWHFVG